MFYTIFIYVLLLPEAEPKKSNVVLKIGFFGKKVLPIFLI